MALDTLGGLKAAVASWLNRGDLTTQIPDFLEAAMSDINAQVRHWRMEERAEAVLPAGDSILELPSDWREALAVHLQTSPITHLQPRARREFLAYQREATTTGTPAVYCLVGDEIHFAPTTAESVDVELHYVAATSLPSDDAEANWVIRHFPQALLMGALHYAYIYLMDDDRAELHRQRFAAAVQSINRDGSSGQVSPGQSAMGRPL